MPENPMISKAAFDDRIDVYLGSITKGKPFLCLTTDTRDVIVAANAFLAILADRSENVETQMRIERVMSHLSDMMYGFDRS